VALPVKNRLKVLRAERDWTQAQLADALDVSRQTINAIETGKFDPSLPLAFRAARLFGMHIEEIFHDPALDKDPDSLATEIKKDTYA
jgi:putative transcriptional regulator